LFCIQEKPLNLPASTSTNVQRGVLKERKKNEKNMGADEAVIRFRSSRESEDHEKHSDEASMATSLPVA